MTDPAPRAGAREAVLRGGPFDGERVRVEPPLPVVRYVGLVRHVYWPEAESDPEFPSLLVYRHKHTLVY